MIFPFRKETPEQKFWNWFTKNLQQFDQSGFDCEKIINLLSERLIRYKSGLAVEVSRLENGARELTISADGVRDLFPSVQKLVSEAPAIEGWTVMAFRQKAPEGFNLKAGDLLLHPKEMYFHPMNSDGGLDIIIYIDGLDNCDFDTVAYFGLIVVDNLLGEYDCVMKVRSFDFHDLSTVKDNETLYQLTMLSNYVNMLPKSSR